MPWRAASGPSRARKSLWAKSWSSEEKVKGMGGGQPEEMQKKNPQQRREKVERGEGERAEKRRMREMRERSKNKEKSLI